MSSLRWSPRKGLHTRQAKDVTPPLTAPTAAMEPKVDDAAPVQNQLTARPTSNGELSFEDPLPKITLTADAFFSRVNQAGRDQIVYEQNPPFQLGEIPLIAPGVETAKLRPRPSRMLRTYFEIVPFSGRSTELSNFKKWRDTALAGTAIHLIYGPGGQGKTRLAMHLAREWAEEGWITLQAYPHIDFSSINAARISSTETALGLLVVVDYAERWEITNLLSLLRHVAGSEKIPVRIVMLSRPAGTWWQTFLYQVERNLDISVEITALQPLAESPEERVRLFEEARDIFGQILEMPDPTYLRPPLDIKTNSSYGQVLTIHMAALASVLAFVEADYPPRDPAELSAFLLARERSHWLALHTRREDPIRTPPDAMRQAVYTATLTGPLNYIDAMSALQYAQIESPEPAGQILRDHAQCYPPYEDQNVLVPLYPDRLGEDFIALTTPGHNNAIYPADPWAPGALRRLLSSPADMNEPPWILSAKTILAEIGERWPHVASLTVAGTPALGKHHRRL